MNNIRMVEEVEYTGKFKIGDDVRVVGSATQKNGMSGFIDEVGVVERVFLGDNRFPYLVFFRKKSDFNWLNEAELELVNKNDMKTLDNQLNEICTPKMNKASKIFINQTNNKQINTDITLTLEDIEKLNQFDSVFHDSKHLVELLDSLGNHEQANELMQNLLSVKEVVDNVDKQRNQIAKELLRKECDL